MAYKPLSIPFSKRAFIAGLSMTLCLLALTAFGQTSAPNEISELAPSQTLEREMTGAQTHRYKVSLQKNEFFQVRVEQKGVDVLLKLSDANSVEKLAYMDSPNGTDGLEVLSFVGVNAGDYTLEVSGFDAKAAKGNYIIVRAPSRPALAQDQRRLEVERVFAEGVQKFKAQDQAAAAKAILAEALRGWRELQSDQSTEKYLEAYTLDALGQIRNKSGENQQAQDYLNQAISLFRTIGDGRGEATALNHLATVYSDGGDNRQALEYANQALSISRGKGDKKGEAGALNQVGYFSYLLGDKEKASKVFSDALKLAQSVGDKREEALSVNGMGLLNQGAKSLEYHNQALALRRSTGDKEGEGISLYNIGLAYISLDKQKAPEYFSQALQLFRTVGYKRGEALVLFSFGNHHMSVGDRRKALEYYVQAVPLFTVLGNKLYEGFLLARIGNVYSTSGELQKALESLNRALSLFKSIDNKHQAGSILLSMGPIHHAMGDTDKAIEALKEALTIFRELKVKPDELITQSTLGSLYSSLSKYREALEYLEPTLSGFRAVLAKDLVGWNESMRKQFERNTLHTMGLAYYGSGEKQKALEFYQQSLRINDELNDKLFKRTILAGMAQVYGSLYEWKKALSYYEQALTVARELNDEGEIAFTLISIGSIYLARSEYRNALERFEQVLKIIREIKSHVTDLKSLKFIKRTEASALNNVALSYDNLGEPQKALGYYNQSLAIRKETSDKDEEAVTYMNIASIYSSLGEYHKALEYINLAQDTFRQSSPVIKASVRAKGKEARFLSAQGSISANLGDWRKALNDHNHALEIARKEGAKDLEVLVLNSIANDYYRLGELRKSLKFSQQSLALSKVVEDKEGEISTRINIGVTNKDLGEKQVALKYLNQALELAKVIQNKSLIATSLFNIGQVYLVLDDSRQALNYYDQALLIYKEIGDKKGQGIVLGDTGFIYSNLGERQKALAFYDQAISIIREIGDKANETIMLSNLGTIYLDLGENQAALDYKIKALIAAQSTGDKQAQATALTGIGKLQLALGDKQKALASLEQALALSRANEYRAIETGSLINLGKTYSELNDKQKALRLLSEALRLARNHSDRWYEEHALSAMGKVYFERGEKRKALDSYNQAQLLARTIDDKEGEALALQGLMSVWKSLDNPSLAVLYGKEAVNKYQDLRRAINNLKKETQEIYLAKVTDAYRELAGILIDEGRLLEAEQVLAMLKEKEITDYLHRDASEIEKLQQRADFRPGEAAALKRYKEIADRIAKISTEYAAFEDRLRDNEVLSGPERKRFEELAGHLKDANLAFQVFLRHLAEELADRTELSKELTENLALQSDLKSWGEGVVFLYTLVENDRYRVILITPEAQADGKYEIKMADLDNKINEFRETVKNPELDPRPLGRELYDILIKPIEKQLEGAKAKTLLWSLDGNLRLLPLTALWNGKQYFGQQYQNVTITLGSRARLGEIVSQNWRVLALGVSEAVTIKEPNGTRELYFAALPAVRTELLSIVQSAESPNGVLPGQRLIDAEFNETALETQLLRGYKVIHIASHFSLNPGDSTKSFLLLGDGNVLTVEEIRNNPQLKFNGVELLTLSACKTAVVGKDSSGKEVEGFGYVAQQKGAKAILATLWSVVDESTQLLMSEFYRLRKENPQITKAEAIQMAQNAMIEGKLRPSKAPVVNGNTGEVKIAEATSPSYVYDSKKPYAHPYYWSPFVLIGNWR